MAGSQRKFFCLYLICMSEGVHAFRKICAPLSIFKRFFSISRKIAVKAGYPKHVKTWLKCASKDPGSLAVGNLHALDERSEAGLP